MAKATLKQEVLITLTLSEKEAMYLKSQCQNYLGRPGEEPSAYREYREGLFRELNNALAPLAPSATPRRTDLDVIADMAN
ncbi:hypothetical protein AEO54_073 [Vibrio phage vB_VorS-PVo5]|nr:hypothetical protein AEO54_073 [Vibrio phage vB_VorS-PVo5]